MLNRQKSIQFWRVWLPPMKSRSPTLTSRENGLVWIAVSRQKRWQSHDWRFGEVCYVFSGIGRKSSLMSCYSTSNHLIRTHNVLQLWIVWKNRSRRSSQLLSLEEVLCPTHKGSESPETPGVCWVVLIHSLPYYMLLSMANELTDEKFTSRESCKNGLTPSLYPY